MDQKLKMLSERCYQKVSRLHFLDWVCNLLIRVVQTSIIDKIRRIQSYDRPEFMG